MSETVSIPTVVNPVPLVKPTAATKSDFNIPSKVVAAQVAPSSFPVPVSDFALTIKGTAGEVYTTLLRINHKRERHTLDEWHEIIASYADQPAH